MGKKDELGIEYDEEIEELLNDPKSERLKKFLDYRDKRKVREQEIAEDQKREEEKKRKKPFWEL